MEPKSGKNQVLELKNRERLSVDSVENVEHFSPSETVLKTAFGRLKICGGELRLEDLSKESGGILLTGRIDSLSFSENRQKHSFFKDLLK